MNEKKNIRSQKVNRNGKKKHTKDVTSKETPMPIATPRREELLQLQYEVMIERKKWIRGESTYESMRLKALAFTGALERRYRDKFDSKHGVKLKLHPAEIVAMPLFLITE